MFNKKFRLRMKNTKWKNKSCNVRQKEKEMQQCTIRARERMHNDNVFSGTSLSCWIYIQIIKNLTLGKDFYDLLVVFKLLNHYYPKSVILNGYFKGVLYFHNNSYCRCLKCNQYLCLSNEMKKIGFHFACVSEKLKNHVTCEKSEDIIFENKKIKIGVGIVKCICGEKIGNVALHRGIHFPMLQIKAIKIEDDKKELRRLKQWKKVEEEYFTVSPLSTRDFKRISESGKLVDMDWTLLYRNEHFNKVRNIVQLGYTVSPNQHSLYTINIK